MEGHDTTKKKSICTIQCFIELNCWRGGEISFYFIPHIFELQHFRVATSIVGDVGTLFSWE